MLKRSQTGFTLIETTLVLAISTLLIGIAISGQSQARQRARFTDAVEKAKNSLARIQNEAVSTYTQGGGNDGGGVTNPKIFFAKKVTFSTGGSSDTMHVETLVIDPATDVISLAPLSTPEDIQLPWGVHYVAAGSTGIEVLFVRWPDTGTLYTFTPPVSGFNDTQFNPDYNPTNLTNRSAKVFQLADNLGHTATLTVDGSTGAITKVFN